MVLPGMPGILGMRTTGASENITHNLRGTRTEQRAITHETRHVLFEFTEDVLWIIMNYLDDALQRAFCTKGLLMSRRIKKITSQFVYRKPFATWKFN